MGMKNGTKNIGSNVISGHMLGAQATSTKAIMLVYNL